MVIGTPTSQEGTELSGGKRKAPSRHHASLIRFREFLQVWWLTQRIFHGQPVERLHLLLAFCRTGLGWKPASVLASGSRDFRGNAGFQAGFGFQAFKSCWL